MARRPLRKTLVTARAGPTFRVLWNRMCMSDGRILPVSPMLSACTSSTNRLFKLGRVLPITVKPNPEGGSWYLMEPDVAELFEKARDAT